MDGVAQTHDARGNRTGAAGRTWRYDSRNMLVGANAPGMAASYGYYPEGGRAWKQVNGVTTLYLEVGGVEWGSYDPAGTLKERTIRASGTGGAVVAVQSPTAGLIRLLPNRQGSVIGWLRPDGKLGGAYTYDAYGNSAQAGAAGPQFRYAGMRFDAETGLYHTPNRAYDPLDGRWMQLDPAGLVDGLNRYAYVRNSPVNYIDLLGLCGSRDDSGKCHVNVDDDTGEKGKIAGEKLEQVLNKYDKAVNALKDGDKFKIRNNDGKVIGSMTGKEIKAVWNGTSFSVTNNFFNNGGAGGGTSGKWDGDNFSGRSDLNPDAVISYANNASSPFVGVSTLVFHELGHPTHFGEGLTKMYPVTSNISWERERATSSAGRRMAQAVNAPFACDVPRGCE